MLPFIHKYIYSEHSKSIGTKMFEKFDFISDDDEPKEYKVLVLGESGVGKTSFINALHLFSFKSPTKCAEMNETSAADCAFEMRNVVKSIISYVLKQRDNLPPAKYRIAPYLHYNSLPSPTEYTHYHPM